MASDTVTFQEAATLVNQRVQPQDAGDMPYIGLEHIEEGNLRLLGVGSSKDVTSTKSRFSKGDILFGKLRPYFRKVIRASFDGVCSTDLWVVRSKPGIDQGYLYYWMASQTFVNFATQGSEGTKMPRAKWEHVGRFKQTRLPETDQHAIAHILGSLDDKIELNRRMNETLEAMTCAIFKSWFVDFDPVRAKMEGRQPAGMDEEIAALFPDSYEDSKLGQIPKGWRITSLDKISKFLNGVASQKYPPTDDDSLPVIKIAELRSGITDKTGRANTTMGSQYIVEDGDVLFSWSGSLMVKIWCRGKGILNQHLFKVTSESYPKWFFYFWTRHYLPSFQAIAADKATTMGHIKRHHLSDAHIVLPPNSVIQKGSEVITPLIDALVANEIQDRKLIDIRDALLPKLLSGEVRIKDSSKFTENLELNATYIQNT